MERVLRGLRMVYISHMHADHHLGLCKILGGRQRVCEGAEPLLVVGPRALGIWLRELRCVYMCMRLCACLRACVVAGRTVCVRWNALPYVQQVPSLAFINDLLSLGRVANMCLCASVCMAIPEVAPISITSCLLHNIPSLSRIVNMCLCAFVCVAIPEVAPISITSMSPLRSAIEPLQYTFVDVRSVLARSPPAAFQNESETDGSDSDTAAVKEAESEWDAGTKRVRRELGEIGLEFVCVKVDHCPDATGYGAVSSCLKNRAYIEIMESCVAVMEWL